VISIGSSEQQTLGASSRKAPLDGLRALAALSVLVFHVWLYGYSPPPSPRTTFTDKLLFELNLGLICFFVLSGFLLYQAFARASLGNGSRVDFKNYAVRRAARIVPAYYVCLVGCLLLYWLVGLTRLIPPAENLPLFAVFGQNYSTETVMEINPVVWTLSVEVAMYLFLPVIGYAALRLGARRLALQTAMLLGLIGVTLLWNYLVRTGSWMPLGPKVLPAYLGHFALGMLAALWFEHRRSKDSRPIGVAATAALMAAGFGFVLADAIWREAFGSDFIFFVLGGLPAALGFALMIAGAAAGRGRAIDWLSVRPLVWVGLVSYGLYLWHLPLLIVVRQLEILPHAFGLRVLFVLAISLVAAALSWRLIEQPMIRRYSSARKRPAANQPLASSRVATADT
jgi:peptidoglycan/LPS O-acetylase OafA/YrhL